MDWSHQLAEQLDWPWRAQLRPRLDGLTDAEYRWEPVPGGVERASARNRNGAHR